MIRLRGLLGVLFLVPVCAIAGRAKDLNLLVSVRQQSIVASSPVRATLHFHNSGQRTLWLYQPVLSKLMADRSPQFIPGVSENRPGQIYGGSTLAVKLVALSAAGNGKKEVSGRGFVISPGSMPHPRLVRLGPGKDCQEEVSIEVRPALRKTPGGDQPVWGRYKFSVTYSADYSNGEFLKKYVHADVWKGEVDSNSITLDLRPPTAHGSISGTVLDRAGRPYSGALVTLSDNNENSISQVHSDVDGRFSFGNLPAAQYWITVREPYVYRDTSEFRQFNLSQPDSQATAQIMMLPEESDKADRFLHKPVLFHIVDNKGHLLSNVKLSILFSMGRVIQSLKTRTDEDGFATINLIPGTSFVTLQMHGCKSEDRQADVVHSPGINGFEFVYDCIRK